MNNDDAKIWLKLHGILYKNIQETYVLLRGELPFRPSVQVTSKFYYSSEIAFWYYIWTHKTSFKILIMV